MRFTVKTALAASALLLLAACGSTQEAARPCPVAVMVQDAGKLVKFRGEGRDLTDVVYEAAIEDLKYGCEYDGDEAIEMVVTVSFVAGQGPANITDSADFTYFLAVATADRQILAREDFPVSIPFEGNLTRVRLTETLEPRIPLLPGESGASFRVFVGLALTEAELQYNRSRQ